MTGKIKFYNPTKGFGFITTAAGVDLFFHITNVAQGISPEQLQEGVEVTFDEGMGRKGPQAENVALGAAGSAQGQDDFNNYDEESL